MVVREIPEEDLNLVEDAPDEVLQMPEGTEFGSLEDLMNAKLQMHELYIPEVKKKFYLRILDGREVDRYNASILTGRGQNMSVNTQGMRAKFVVLVLGKADGTRILTDSDAKEVQKWPAVILERIFDRGRKINGMTDDADNLVGNL